MTCLIFEVLITIKYFLKSIKYTNIILYLNLDFDFHPSMVYRLRDWWVNLASLCFAPFYLNQFNDPCCLFSCLEVWVLRIIQICYLIYLEMSYLPAEKSGIFISLIEIDACLSVCRPLIIIILASLTIQ